jgi:hypothetical protein
MLSKTKHDVIWEDIETKVVRDSINKWGIDKAYGISEREVERHDKYIKRTAFKINRKWIIKRY